MEGKKIEKKQSETKDSLPKWRRVFGVPLTEKIFFVQHLHVMLKAGLSLGEALNTLSEQAQNTTMKIVLKDVALRTNEGQSFAQSLKRYPSVFEDLFVNMIEAGEISGKYEEVLAEMHIHMKKSHEIRGKVKGAMIYPVVILFAMIIIGAIMMTFVIPKLIGIFNEVAIELPLPTRILISISDGFAQYGIYIGIAFISMIVLTVTVLKREKPKKILHAILLRLPIFGNIIKKINIARFSRTLSSLLKTDIPIIDSLRMTSRVLGNRQYRDVLQTCAQEVKKGKAINEVLLKNPRLFFPVVTQMIYVGEKTGSLDKILEELALFYEEEVSQTMDNLPSIIEPVLILFLGVGVGAMAIALIMPLYSITEAI